MPRITRNQLSAPFVRTITKPGKYPDGGNLYLQVKPSGSKSWLFRYWTGKDTAMGLGPVEDLSLAEARKKASEYRQILRDGRDPLIERQTRKATMRVQRMTFEDCAAQYMATKKDGWSAKNASQWQNTLTTYAYPIIGREPVSTIDIEDVERVLRPIWKAKTETASRVRGRIEMVLDFATAKKYRTGDNPARWQGNLANVFAEKAKVAPKVHLEAMPYNEIHSFIRRLRKLEGIAPRALEFTILTAARTTEVIAAKWDEFDLETKIWTIPAARMKAGQEHRVPLSERAVAILDEVRVKGSPWVFAGHKRGSHLSNMAMLSVLRKRMAIPSVTVHGFRSTFRDWAGDCTAYPNHVCEMALAHTIGDAVEKSYRRSDLFQKRSRLMLDWAAFIEKQPRQGEVLALRAAR